MRRQEKDFAGCSHVASGFDMTVQEGVMEMESNNPCLLLQHSHLAQRRADPQGRVWRATGDSQP